MQVRLENNIKRFTKDLNFVQREQVPYATSRALNDTAVHAQKFIQSQIQNKFKNTRKWWLRQQPTGIKVEFSKKNKLFVSVFTKAYFAQIQEKGGIKTPRGKVIAVPTEKAAKKYRNSKGVKKLLQSRKRSFSTPVGVFVRKSKKVIEAIFIYTRKAVVKPRFNFERSAETVFKHRFKQQFDRWLKIALQTTRK